MGLNEITIRFKTDLKSLSTGFQNASRKMKKLGDEMVSIGKKFSVFSAVVTGAGIGALKVSIDFETAFAGVIKTVNATESEFKSLEKGIREMSERLPASAIEIANVAEAAGQLGIQKKNILGFTETMINLGNSTNLSSTDAATALARFANIVGTSQADFDRLGSVIVGLGNNFATTEQEIVDLSLRLAGAGSQIGLSESDILAFSTALSSVGVEAEAGGSAFSKLFIEISKSVKTGGKTLSNFAKVSGESSAEFKKSFETDAASAIQSFLKGLQNISKSGGNVFKTLEGLNVEQIRLIDVLLRSSNAADLVADALQRGSTEWEENTALTDEANKRYSTTESKLLILKNRLLEVSRIFGDALKPTLISILEFFDPVVEALKNMAVRFKNLSEGTKKTILAITGIIVAIGPLMLIFGTLLKTLPLIASLFVGLSAPIAGTLLGIAAITALIINNWDSITASVSALAVAMESFSNKTKKASDNTFKIGEGLQFTFVLVGSFAAAILEAISSGLIFAITILKRLGGALDGLFKLNFDKISAEFQELGNDLFFGGLESEKRFSDIFENFKRQVVDIITEVNDEAVVEPSLDTEKLKKQIEDLLDSTKIPIVSDTEKLDAIPKKVTEEDLSEIDRQISGLSGAGFLDKLFVKEGRRIVKPDEVVPQDDIDTIVSRLQLFNEEVSLILQDAAFNFLTSFGEIAGAFAIGDASIKDIGNLLLSTLADIMIQLGKSAIAIGLTIEAISAALKSFFGPFAIVAGIALIALGNIIKSSISSSVNNSAPKLAKGGLAFGTTSAIVGDNLNARTDPEVIAPLSKLKNFISPGQNIQVGGVIEIGGQKLRIVLDRADKIRRRNG